jgi:hypothetical protein
MPLKPDDRVVPGSEKACEAVDDRLMADIVADFRHGPASLPIASPEPHARGSGWVEPAPLRPYEGSRYVDAICDHFDQQDRLSAQRLAKIEEMMRTLASMQPNAEVERLKAEVEQLKADLEKARAK